MTSPASNGLPLKGVRVLEFTHMIMGPACGLVLADLGAEVIKIEPTPLGDNSRRLIGPALGFFPTFNRNKKSLCVNLKSEEGMALVRQLASKADVVVENFRPGAMTKIGLGYDDLAKINPRLIYCACKGFLPGPYEHRTALDEVVQMMGGLAYMTGPPGQPLRAGASINDIMGGVFGVVAILAALRQRETSGVGGMVQSGLFETNMMLVAQHMAFSAIEGRDLESFGDPSMQKPWPLYDAFDTNVPGQQVFVGAVTDSQWKAFCGAFGMEEFSKPELTMSKLARMRDVIKPRIADIFKKESKADLMKRFEELGLPYAPVAKPADMFHDPHLAASGGLLDVELSTAEKASGGQPKQQTAGLPALPIDIFGDRTILRQQPPRAGEHSIEVALEAGLSSEAIQALIAKGVIVAGEDSVPEQNPAKLAANAS